MAVMVTVVNIDPQQGFVVAALHGDGGWAAQPAAVARAPANSDQVVVTLRAPSPGRYGVQLFLDANANGRMDTNLMGMPTERFGFSNNAVGSFGPPTFEATAFQIGADGATQTITLR